MIKDAITPQMAIQIRAFFNRRDRNVIENVIFHWANRLLLPYELKQERELAESMKSHCCLLNFSSM